MDKDFLHRQLVKLGDMMGDGLHKEPDGKWISREYAKIAKQLGYAPPRRNNSEKLTPQWLSELSKSAAKNAEAN